MSSMFKKKSGAGFKPKAPIARARPAAATQQSKPAGASSTSEAQLPQQATTAAPVDSVQDTTAAASSGPDEFPRQPQIADSTQSVETTPAVEVDATKATTSVSQPSAPEPIPSGPSDSSAPTAQAQDRHESEATPTTDEPQVAPTMTPASAQSTTDPSLESSSTEQTSVSTAEKSQKAAESQVKQAPRKAPASRGRKRTIATTTEDGTDAAQGEEAQESEQAQPAKKRRAPKKKAAIDGETGVETPQRRPRRPRQLSGEDGEQSQQRRRKQRSATPEDAESQHVDFSTMTMADLTKDLRIGRKSKVHDKLVERERVKIAALKQRRANGALDALWLGSQAGSPAPGLEGATPGPSSPPAPGQAGVTSPTAAAAAEETEETQGLQYKVIDGQIIIDQSSLALDRHARDQQGNANLQTTEEDAFTHHVTETSFRTSSSKLRGPNSWNEDDTELFYRALGMLGTDFEMISKMFPGRQRRHVKMKFNREERANPQRIHKALVGEKTLKLDLDEYKHWTKAEYEPVEDIMAAQRLKQAEYDARQKEIADEKAETMRKKKEALFADEDGDAGVPKKKKKGKKKKGHVETNAWGEVIEETAVEA